MAVTNIQLLHDGFFEIFRTLMFYRDTKISKTLYGYVIDESIYYASIRPLLIQTDEKGLENILIDTGIGNPLALPEAHRRHFNVNKRILVRYEAPRGKLGGMQQISRFEEVSLEKSLAKLKLKIDNIDLVINTHLHPDHCGGNYNFKNREILVQLDEFKYAKAPEKPIKSDYLEELISPTQLDYRQICADNYKLCNGVLLIKTPGHTPGHQSIVITYNGKTFVYAGDACPTAGHFKKGHIIGLYHNITETLNSLERLKNIEGSHIFCHEADSEEVMLENKLT